jgi:hypothetical protein
MINILRTKQVRAAQKGIPTGLVYKQNEKTLAKVGVDKLETMLRLRDWSDTAEYKVNRREYDALKLAQDFQATGTVSAKDTNLHDDSVPAANKVDRRQVEKGNLVNVIIQALEKRLGKISGDKVIKSLSGPETSATAMATDVLIQELLDIAENASSTSSSSPTTVTSSSTGIGCIGPTSDAADNEDIPIDILLARQKRIADARRFLQSDADGSTVQPQRQRFAQTADPIADVLFGKDGIGQASTDDDELFSDGMDPRSFF